MLMMGERFIMNSRGTSGTDHQHVLAQPLSESLSIWRTVRLISVDKFMASSFVLLCMVHGEDWCWRVYMFPIITVGFMMWRAPVIWSLTLLWLETQKLLTLSLFHWLHWNIIMLCFFSQAQITLTFEIWTNSLCSLSAMNAWSAFIC